jgi:hypothetical protein
MSLLTQDLSQISQKLFAIVLNGFSKPLREVLSGGTYSFLKASWRMYTDFQEALAKSFVDSLRL